MANRPGEMILQTGQVNTAISVAGVGSGRLTAFGSWVDDETPAGVDFDAKSGFCVLQLADGTLFEDRLIDQALFSSVTEDRAILEFTAALKKPNGETIPATLWLNIDDKNDTLQFRLTNAVDGTVIWSMTTIQVPASRLLVTQKFVSGGVPDNQHPIPQAVEDQPA